MERVEHQKAMLQSQLVSEGVAGRRGLDTVRVSLESRVKKGLMKSRKHL